MLTEISSNIFQIGMIGIWSQLPLGFDVGAPLFSARFSTLLVLSFRPIIMHLTETGGGEYETSSLSMQQAVRN